MKLFWMGTWHCGSCGEAVGVRGDLWPGDLHPESLWLLTLDVSARVELGFWDKHGLTAHVQPSQTPHPLQGLFPFPLLHR